jgi:hypothetical protein
MPGQLSMSLSWLAGSKKRWLDQIGPEAGLGTYDPHVKVWQQDVLKALIRQAYGSISKNRLNSRLSHSKVGGSGGW